MSMSLDGHASLGVHSYSSQRNLRHSPPTSVSYHAVVDDIGKWVLFDRPDGRLYTVGSIAVDRYLVVPESKVDIVMRVVHYLNGTHDLGWIQDQIGKEYGKKVSIKQLFIKLSDAGLVKTARRPAGPQSEFLRNSVPLFSFPVGGLFSHLAELRALFSPFAMLAGIIIIVAGLQAIPLSRVSTLGNTAAYGSTLFHYGALWFGLLLLALIHECFHGFAGIRYGLTPTRISVALYLGFIPYIFISIPGIYTIKPKERLVVWSAGMYANLLIGGLLSLIYIHLDAVTFTAGILAELILVNVMLVAFNLFPFMATDSYFLLSTIFKVPNVRTNAYVEFKRWMKKEKNSFRTFLAVYTLASLVMIGYFLVHFVQWLAGLFIAIKLHGVTTQNLVDMLPLGVMVIGYFAQWMWKRKDKIGRAGLSEDDLSCEG